MTDNKERENRTSKNIGVTGRLWRLLTYDLFTFRKDVIKNINVHLDFNGVLFYRLK